MVELADILAARERIRDSISNTPCVHSPLLSARTGAEVFYKLEILQFTGAFKERGALNKILCLSPEERARGVIAASAGNHAQGVAYHAKRNGLRATIVMPEPTPLIKVANTRQHDAEVVLHGQNYEEAYTEAQRRCQEDGLTFIHPFDDELVIAGQGTIGLELLEALPDLEAVVVPVGGGGLIAGVAAAIKLQRPDVLVLGVQPERLPSMVRSLEAGQLVSLEPSRTIAEGIQVRRPGTRTFELVQRFVDEVGLVKEDEIAAAIVLLLEREKLLTEGAGAAGVAALMHAAFPQLRAKRVAVLLSGGNIDVHLLNLIIERNLVREGRLVRLAVQLDDRPGALAQFLTVVGEQGGNVMQVQHNRVFCGASLWQADIDITLETRNSEHAEQLKAALCQQGYLVRNA